MGEEAIPILRVSDLERSMSWYARLGYREEWTDRPRPGGPAFSSIARNRGSRLFLSEHLGDAQPGGLVYLRVADIEAVANALGVTVETVDGRREIHLRDPDDNRIRVGAD